MSETANFEQTTETKPPRLPHKARWVAAVCLTFVLLPLPLGRTIVGFKIGHHAPAFIIAFVVGLVVVSLLTRRLAYGWKQAPGILLIALLACGWIAISSVLTHLRASDAIPWYVIGPALGTSTIWALAFTWLWAFPGRTYHKLLLMLPLVGWAIGFWQVYNIEGLDGNAKLEFVRRGTRSTLLSAASRIATPTENNVTPTNIELDAQSFPGFLGPDRNGRLADRNIADDWDVNPPVELWRREVGKGWSGFVASQQYAFTQESRGATESVVCYDIPTGDEVWLHSDDTYFDSVLAGSGPRCCPVLVTTDVNGVARSLTVTVGATGIVNCLNASTGEAIWQKDLLAEFGGENLVHGICASPLVLNDLVIVCPPGENGPCIVAYSLADGETVWTGDTGQQQRRLSYSSPAVGEFDGQTQIILHNGPGVSGFDPATGKELWFFEWTNQYDNNASQPIISNNQILASTGYGKGSTLVDIVHEDDATWSTKTVWKTRNLKSKYCTPVEYDFAYFGLDDGILSCVDKSTGKKLWKRGRYGHGQILLVDDLLLIQCERGEITLVRPSKDKLQEIAVVPALTAKTWNNLCLSGQHLIVRNDREAVCFKLNLKE